MGRIEARATSYMQLLQLNAEAGMANGHPATVRPLSTCCAVPNRKNVFALHCCGGECDHIVFICWDDWYMQDRFLHAELSLCCSCFLLQELAEPCLSQPIISPRFACTTCLLCNSSSSHGGYHPKLPSACQTCTAVMSPHGNKLDDTGRRVLLIA